MKREWKIIEVENKIRIPIEWRHNDYGRMELQVCIKYIRGKMVEFWVYPKQSTLENCWHCKTSYANFALNSYDGLGSSKAWLFFYCKEHKTQSFYVYVPRNTTILEINHQGIDFLKV